MLRIANLKKNYSDQMLGVAPCFAGKLEEMIENFCGENNCDDSLSVNFDSFEAYTNYLSKKIITVLDKELTDVLSCPSFKEAPALIKFIEENKLAIIEELLKLDMSHVTVKDEEEFKVLTKQAINSIIKISQEHKNFLMDFLTVLKTKKNSYFDFIIRISLIVTNNFTELPNNDKIAILKNIHSNAYCVLWILCRAYKQALRLENTSEIEGLGKWILFMKSQGIKPEDCYFNNRSGLDFIFSNKNNKHIYNFLSFDTLIRYEKHRERERYELSNYNTPDSYYFESQRGKQAGLMVYLFIAFSPLLIETQHEVMMIGLTLFVMLFAAILSLLSRALFARKLTKTVTDNLKLINPAGLNQTSPLSELPASFFSIKSQQKPDIIIKTPFQKLQQEFHEYILPYPYFQSRTKMGKYFRRDLSYSSFQLGIQHALSGGYQLCASYGKKYAVQNIVRGGVEFAMAPITLSIKIPLRILWTCFQPLCNPVEKQIKGSVKKINQLCNVPQTENAPLLNNPLKSNVEISFKEARNLHTLFKQNTKSLKTTLELTDEAVKNEKQAWQKVKKAFFDFTFSEHSQKDDRLPKLKSYAETMSFGKV